jgi:hypothetical protein
LFLRKDFPAALLWLDRAYDTLDSRNIDRLSREAAELRMIISQSLIRTLLETDHLENLGRAREIVTTMEASIGAKLPVLLLQLDILNKSPRETFDSGAYANVLQRMIKTFDFSNSAFKLITHHIRRLHEKQPELGCNVLDSLLAVLSGFEEVEWTERVVITRLWMATNQTDAIKTVQQVESVVSNVRMPLRQEAAIAAQTVGKCPLRLTRLSRR